MTLQLVALILVGSISALGVPRLTVDDPTRTMANRPGSVATVSGCQWLEETLDSFSKSWTSSFTFLHRNRGPLAALAANCRRVSTAEFRETTRSAAEKLADTIVQQAQEKAKVKAVQAPPPQPTASEPECKVEQARSDRRLQVVVRCSAQQLSNTISASGTTTHISQQIHASSTITSRAD